MTFGQPKPLASLSSGLLARKGQARPAMRPQGFGGFGAPPSLHDDLGWNDMGQEDAAAPVPVPPPAPTVPVPQVVRQIEALQEEFEPAPAPAPAVPPALRPVSVATAARIDRETQTKHGARAAFTLRLDHDRHLRLRLASALHHRSAQALVTDALDAFLHSLPDVEELVRQLPPPKAGR